MTHLETYNGITYKCDDTYSDKDCTGWDLSDRKNMNGIVIHGLCLSNETPNAQVLPKDLQGTTFLLCNLDNVFIPPGNQLIDCSNRLFEVQTDGEDWQLDPKTLDPIAPINVDAYTALGLSVDPADLPQEQLDQSIILKATDIVAQAQMIAVDQATVQAIDSVTPEDALANSSLASQLASAAVATPVLGPVDNPAPVSKI